MEGFLERDFGPELVFSASRSSGPGGQNVNKVNSRIELRFRIPSSCILTEDEKSILLEKLKNRLTGEGELILVSQTDRSQLKNKEIATARFYKLIEKTLTPVKNRIPTGPTASSKQKRLENKKIRSMRKDGRKKPEA